MRPSPHDFVAFLEAREDWLFGYGREPNTHDCARFCAAGVRAMTGCDPLAHFVGQWTTRIGAARVIARHGGLAAAVGTVMTPIPPTMAPRGAVALIQGGGLALVEGEHLVGPAPVRGLERVARSAMIQAWVVGQEIDVP